MPAKTKVLLVDDLDDILAALRKLFSDCEVLEARDGRTALTLAAKAFAFLHGRGYVTPQDVKSIGMDVLRHRVAITYEAEAEEKTSESIIQKIFDELPVP